MVNNFIKTIFLLITIFILWYCISYVKFEFENKNIGAGITVLLFSLASVVFSNVVFWIE